MRPQAKGGEPLARGNGMVPATCCWQVDAFSQEAHETCRCIWVSFPHLRLLQEAVPSSKRKNKHGGNGCRPGAMAVKRAGGGPGGHAEVWSFVTKPGHYGAENLQAQLPVSNN